MFLSGSMTLSYVLGLGVEAILQRTGDTLPLLKRQTVVLFDIPIIGLFKAVRLESNALHLATMLNTQP